MFWNNRIVCTTDDEGNHWYGTHEVFYEDDGKLACYTANPVEPGAETMNDLEDIILMYGEAMKRPVLYEEDFEGLDCEQLHTV